MKGDFSRVTFDATRRYSGVRLQQGRVLLDADWNEQRDIDADHDRAVLRDVIGPMGVPIDEDGADTGFKVDIVIGDLIIGAGRIYLDGLLVENAEDVSYDDQPITPAMTLAATLNATPDAGLFAVYVVAWEHHRTALDDAELREVALEGPDTTTRTQVVWRVGLRRLSNDPDSTISDIPDADWTSILGTDAGRLVVGLAAAGPLDDPCLGPSDEGYRGLENQLYRVQVHRSSSTGSPTYKWSRENGSVVYAWVDESGYSVDASLGPITIAVEPLGDDAALGLVVGDKVELTSERFEIDGRPGRLGVITEIDGSTIKVEIGDGPTTGADTITLASFGSSPKVRRWERAAGDVLDPAITASPDIELENGILIQFKLASTGPDEAFQSGQYWTFAARTATGQLDWPEDLAEQGFLPHGPIRRGGLLGLLRWRSTPTTADIDQRRPLFPALTDLTRLEIVSGQGQRGMPGGFLRSDLVARVMNGRWPVAGATVRFSILTSGTGDPGAVAPITGTPAPSAYDAITDANGIARARWRLGDTISEQSQIVQAVQIQPSGLAAADQPVYFTATFPDFWLARAYIVRGSAPTTVYISPTSSQLNSGTSSRETIVLYHGTFKIRAEVWAYTHDDRAALEFYDANMVIYDETLVDKVGRGTVPPALPYVTPAVTIIRGLFKATPLTSADPNLSGWELETDLSGLVTGMPGSGSATYRRFRVRIAVNNRDPDSASIYGGWQAGAIDLTFLVHGP